MSLYMEHPTRLVTQGYHIVLSSTGGIRWAQAIEDLHRWIRQSSVRSRARADVQHTRRGQHTSGRQKKHVLPVVKAANAVVQDCLQVTSMQIRQATCLFR